MINGENFDFEDIKVLMNGVPLVNLTEINYSDEQEWEPQYGTGSRPIAMGRGNYKASGDMTLRRNEYDTLRAIAALAGKSIFDFNPFVVVAAWGDKIQGSDGFMDVEHVPTHTDTLMNCVFNKRTFAGKQNDKGNTVKLDILIEKVMPG